MGMMGMMGITRRRPNDPLFEPLYDAYAINGKVFGASPPLRVGKGDRVRFRIINSSASTIYSLRISGHPLTITHADGRPVVPYEVDVLRIAMGERYDVELHAANPGRWYIHNVVDGTPVSGWALGTLLYEGIESKAYNADSSHPFRVNDYNLMKGIRDQYFEGAGGVDKTFRLILSDGMMGSPYWMINGRVYPRSENIEVNQGERVRLEYFNRSMMPHPMHLHGQGFEVVGSGQSTGIPIVKDTLIIYPMMGRGAVEFVADHPGLWFHHCHNLYHLKGGMANIVKVLGRV
jgi:FtsP/CotA-like multicopper oxidase with cupredoxin domain